MAIVSIGEKLPATYLERFDPAENVVYRISILATKAIAVEFHWVDVPSKNIKGVFQCIQGVCCQAWGRRSQTYNVPIYVYRNPQQSTEGEIMVWQMTPARWKKFSDLALQVDLGVYDIMLTAQKRGLGLDQSYSVVPDIKLRDYWTPDQKNQLHLAAESFFQMGEASLINPMALNDWNQLLYDVGYDLQNQCWPGGQSPLNSGSAFTAIRGAVQAPALPPAPPPGFNQVQQMPSTPVATVFQPAPPLPGAVPKPIVSTVMPTTATVQPMQPPSQSVLPTQSAQPMASSFGTVPAVSQTFAPPPNNQVNVQVPSNEVPVAMEITAEELNKMLE